MRRFRAERLREAMSASSFATQAPFAEAVGVSQRTLTNWLSGKTVPDGEHIGKLADVTGRDPDWFYGAEADADSQLAAALSRTEEELARIRQQIQQEQQRPPSKDSDETNWPPGLKQFIWSETAKLLKLTDEEVETCRTLRLSGPQRMTEEDWVRFVLWLRTLQVPPGRDE